MTNPNVIEMLNDITKSSIEFQYSMLGRLKTDCEYFLGNGNRHVKHLWALDASDHVGLVKALFNHLESNGKKIEWLSIEDILKFEKEMK